MIRDKIDGVTIEADENGFHIWFSGEDAEYHFLLPGNVADELLRAVKREIEPWVAEGQVAALMRDGTHDDAGYDIDDPKHPTYHERASEIWDSREGK